ncbi:hypothetical protein [Nocardia donostiensis]|uniref:hypothetical protein n=1 Tax=Nocardia donostiensis TaxID=1538463 RepID=UPI0011154E4C|nr:hypothetical protein [Nocardia donostiensis]
MSRTVVTAELLRRGLAVLGDAAGSPLVVPLPTVDAERRAVAAGRAAGVLLDGLARHHSGRQRVCGIALGYAALPESELTTAARIAGECLSHP